MADPTMQTFCCIQNNATEEGMVLQKLFTPFQYNVACIVSSIIGILGSIYQIIPRKTIKDGHRGISFFMMRGRKIIIWLATADLFASLAVLIRSVYWLIHMNLFDQTKEGILFCATSSAFIQYFYTCTWLWTLCYAIDVHLVLQEKPGLPILYHSISWGVPLVTCLTGLSVLYLPDFKCHKGTENALLRILPNYLLTFIPIATVMIVNPVIYAGSNKKIKDLLIRKFGRFTYQEHKLVSALKIKFCCINVVYYLCWIPNILSGIILWTTWGNLPVTVVLTLWYIMAILNPLQAFFNCLVYRRWGEGAPSIQFSCLGSEQSTQTLEDSLPNNHNTRAHQFMNESTSLLSTQPHCINGARRNYM